MTPTIFALSSGRPPAAIAVVRVSGDDARRACVALAGTLPAPRRASLRTLRSPDGAALDQALVVFFPAPNTATGEDLVEFHLHGGRAVVAAVEDALAVLPDVVPAKPGEFTRRALANGRLDLAQTEGLADLLEAETETQRRVALAAVDGLLSRRVEAWLRQLTDMAAQVEAELDFADEGDVADARAYDVVAAARPLLADMQQVLAQPSVERLRDGVTVVLAGPRNAGKSSLFNALLGREAAIVTPLAGTTRDVLEADVVRAGLPLRLIDTAGLVEETDDPVEAIGIARARGVLATSDVVLWLGEPPLAPRGAIVIHSRSDVRPIPDSPVDLATSVFDEASIARLWSIIDDRARRLLASGSDIHLRQRQRQEVEQARQAVLAIDGVDPLLDAEHLRIATRHLGALLGRDATEMMLDALFGRFCLGK